MGGHKLDRSGPTFLQGYFAGRISVPSGQFLQLSPEKIEVKWNGYPRNNSFLNFPIYRAAHYMKQRF